MRLVIERCVRTTLRTVMRRRISFAGVVIVAFVATLAAVRSEDHDAKPYGIEKYVPVTTSTVIGSPDPPPPYRVEKLFPKLKINYPICVRPQPNTDLMFCIDETSPYSPTRICRFRQDADAAELEILLPLKDVAYDIVFHPRYVENGYVYIGSNGADQAGKIKTRITRYVVDRRPPYKFDPASATVIIDWESNGHNGGSIAFGNDGMMYVTSGDGTADSDGNIAGQDMTKLLSKVLRIDVDHPDPGKMYSVPKDNPFVGREGIRPETWAYGLRNPWRLTYDSKSDQLWVGQNGQDLWEQAYLVHPGENYGWSIMEGSHSFYPDRKQGPTPIVMPTVEHHHSEFRSLTGGVVYRGKKYPELDGVYIYGDYSTGKIWGVKHDGRKVIWNRELADSHLQITWIGADHEGELIIADHRGDGKGGFYTFAPMPKGVISHFPRKLSESGLFESVSGNRMKAGAIPYSVNAALWSDGAYKERWMVLPGESPKIDFTKSRGWGFPDRTVLVKSFALEMEAGNSKSRKWIETRFLTKQDGEWYGYSYLWNDEQTDATLVDRGGLDKEYSIRSAAETRTQKWHYPSRAECMVCHSRAANFVLGLSELQMNRDHDYGGIVDNQIRELKHLGVLKMSAEDEKTPALADSQSNKLVDPYDRTQDIDKRARSWIHANCSQCHVEAGGGNARMELEFTTAREGMRVFDVKPLHHTFGLPDARLIAPGHPERSVLLHRISNRGDGHMPPLATNVVDREAVELVREWIEKSK